MTLRQAKREFEAAQEAVNGILLVILNSNRDRFNKSDAFQALYYAQPNITQTNGYGTKGSKFATELADMPELALQLGLAVGKVLRAGEAAVVVKNEEAAAKTTRRTAQTAKREARKAYKGDVKLIEAMSAPRAEYRERCVTHIRELISITASKLAQFGNDLELAYPYPKSNVARDAARRMIDDRKVAEKYFSGPHTGTTAYIVAPRENTEEIVSATADAMVAQYFDGYIIKLSGKIGKPVATATHRGSIWQNGVLSIICEDGEKQVWHTQCIINRSYLGNLFNQWPTRRKS